MFHIMLYQPRELDRNKDEFTFCFQCFQDTERVIQFICTGLYGVSLPAEMEPRHSSEADPYIIRPGNRAADGVIQLQEGKQDYLSKRAFLSLSLSQLADDSWAKLPLRGKTFSPHGICTTNTTVI